MRIEMNLYVLKIDDVVRGRSSTREEKKPAETNEI